MKAKPNPAAAFALAVIIAGSSITAPAQETADRGREDNRDRLRLLAEVAEEVLKEHELDADVSFDDIQLTISYRNRKFQVHWRNKAGIWSDEARTVTGPDTQGFRMVVFLQNCRYAGQWMRPEVTLADYSLGATIREPYFTLRGSTTDLPHINANVQVNIYHGDSCNLDPVVALHKRWLETFVAQKWMDPPTPQPERPALSPNLRAADPQVRCDAFYAVFGSPLPNDHDFVLYGKSMQQIHDLLGRPSRVAQLQHAGINWLRVTYEFDLCPSQARDAARQAWKDGWRYAPSLCFRDGISVPQERMVRELDLLKYAMPPEHLRFKPGGQFP